MSTWLDGSSASRTGRSLEESILDATPYINAVEEYGATGDGTTDDTTALQNAVNAAVSETRPLWIPPGLYNISSTLDMEADGLQVMGAGWRLTQIRQTTSNTPVVNVGGDYQMLSNMSFTFTTAQTSANTSGNVCEINDLFMSRYVNLRFNNGYRGIFLPQTDADGGGNNTVFNCHFENIQINGYAFNAIELRSFNANSTGNVWTNIYVQNNPSGTNQSTTNGAVRFDDCDESVFNQFNIEHSTTSDLDLLRLNRCKGFVFNGLHFEGVVTAGGNTNRRGLVRVSDDSTAVFNGVNVVLSTLSTGTAGQSIFRLGTDVNHLIVNGLYERQNTVNATTFSVVDFDDSTVNNVAEFRGVVTTGTTTFATNDAAGTAPNLVARQRRNMEGTAAPTAGTWERGDKVWNSAPSAGGDPGWVCVAGGTPGTWAAMGNLD